MTHTHEFKFWLGDPVICPQEQWGIVINVGCHSDGKGGGVNTYFVNHLSGTGGKWWPEDMLKARPT